MCLALHIYMTGWYLWPVKGRLNNQCDLVEVLLVSIWFKCTALYASFLFVFWTIFESFFFSFSFLTLSECCLRGIFWFEKGHSQLTALLLTTSTHLYNLTCMLPESKQLCLFENLFK